MPARASLARLDRAHLGRNEPPEDLRVASARGSLVVDAHGREHLDLFMGWCVGNLGWARREIRARMRRFDGPAYVSPRFRYAPWAELAATLADLAPARLERSFRATGGSEAVDVALQAAMLHTGRHKFVSVEGSYHGNTLGTLALGSAEGPLARVLRGSRKLRPPLGERALGALETALKRRDVAALVMEPIGIGLGVRAPEPGFVERAQELCRRHGTLLVMDEVATGFGRTGKLFATEHFDVEPDVMCLAKAITGGHAPMGATLMTEEVARDVEDRLQSYSTYGWHPLAVEAALANLAYLERHEARLMRNVAARGRQLEEGLRRIDWGGDAEVRAKGLALAVELEREEDADRVVQRARRKGALLASDGDTLLLFPALAIDKPTVDRALDVLRAAA